MEKRFGSPLPGYLEKAVRMREKAAEKREQKARDYIAKQEAERARIKSLRKPPRNVRIRNGRIHWDPPETADQLKPAGYWVSQERRGEWTKHSDYLLPDKRSSFLFDGRGPAYVETWYHQMALGEMYRSEIVSN